MAVGCLVQKCSAARQLQALTSIFATRLRLWNAGHSPTAAPNWILCGASQASRTADEVIEYGTRTSDIGTKRKCRPVRHMSPIVEGFGCRPIAAMRLAPWPASESL